MFGTSIVCSKISLIKVDDGVALQNLINITKLNVLDINLRTSQRVRCVMWQSRQRSHSLDRGHLTSDANSSEQHHVYSRPSFSLATYAEATSLTQCTTKSTHFFSLFFSISGLLYEQTIIMFNSFLIWGEFKILCRKMLLKTSIFM